MATELILIRHGNCVRINGDYVHAPLTDLGQEQAELTGKYLCERSERLAGLYCSPLRRARETAARIGAEAGLAPHVKNGIQEVEAAEVLPLVLCETLARSGLLGRYLYTHAGLPVHWPIVGRAARVMTELVALYPEQRVAVVAHSGVISAVLAWYYPMRRRRWWRYTVDNCSLTRLRVEGTRAELVAVNDTRHLQPEITTSQPPAPAVTAAAQVEDTIAAPPPR
jgi:broad specificity phosphatase PhoE